MTAETARAFEALESQAQKLMAVFMSAGYEAVSPSIIQPAGVFLDAIGEALRARTYVFTDPDGDELCLRPDLTVPTCRLHLARRGNGRAPARYCYNGLAFRFQPVGADAAHPREFHQAGIESFGADDREQADALTVSTLLDGLGAAGLTDARLRAGDLGLFRALLDAIDMPDRWRDRLKRHFWRRKAFRAELGRLSQPATAPRNARATALLSGIGPDAIDEAERIVAAHLDAGGVDVIGARSLSEVSRSLLASALDARAPPLDKSDAELIERYLAIECPMADAAARLSDLARAHGLDLEAAIDRFERRLRLLKDQAVDMNGAVFGAEFGRGLEYYTGFVFEIVAPALGPESPVAGGGRYDSLLKTVGAPDDVPAVGAAIHTERLLAATARLWPDGAS